MCCKEAEACKCGSSAEPCSVENVSPGSGAEEDWLSTDADQGPSTTEESRLCACCPKAMGKCDLFHSKLVPTPLLKLMPSELITTH